MTIIEHFDTEDEAKKRGCNLIASLSIPRPVYGLQVTHVVVVGPGREGYPSQHDWTVQIDAKLVELPPTFKGVALKWVEPVDLDSAYQKVLEENAVLRKCNAELLRDNARHIDTISQFRAGAARLSAALTGAPR